MTFKRSEKEGQRVRLTFEGEALEAVEGESLAAALLAAGVKTFRETPQKGEARGP